MQSFQRLLTVLKWNRNKIEKPQKPSCDLRMFKRPSNFLCCFICLRLMYSLTAQSSFGHSTSFFRQTMSQSNSFHRPTVAHTIPTVSNFFFVSRPFYHFHRNRIPFHEFEMSSRFDSQRNPILSTEPRQMCDKRQFLPTTVSIQTHVFGFMIFCSVFFQHKFIRTEKKREHSFLA